MKRPPKIRYKKCVIAKTNPKNLFRIREDEDMDEFLEPMFDSVKREKDMWRKCFDLTFTLQQTVGYVITREFFLELLDYVDILPEEFEAHYQKMKRDKDHFFTFLDWYEDLDKDYFTNINYKSGLVEDL